MEPENLDPLVLRFQLRDCLVAAPQGVAGLQGRLGGQLRKHGDLRQRETTGVDIGDVFRDVGQAGDGGVEHFRGRGQSICKVDRDLHISLGAFLNILTHGSITLM